MGNLSSAGYAIKAQFRNGEVLAGRFTMNNTAAPTVVTPGVGFTVARTGVGVYVITLSQAFRRVFYADANMLLAAASTKIAKVIGITEGGIRQAAQITIEVQSVAGTPADMTATDLLFMVVAGRSGVRVGT